jgi:molybdate transport system regulatory protein
MRRPRVRIRIEFAPARWLGPGKIGLLESVARAGSLKAAAADCGMSYKRAWALMMAANEIFATPLVEMSRGGRGGGGGARVTAAGEAVVAAYREAEREATAATAGAFAGLKTSASRRRRRRA